MIFSLVPRAIFNFCEVIDYSNIAVSGNEVQYNMHSLYPYPFHRVRLFNFQCK
jgi:hypothetical protein